MIALLAAMLLQASGQSTPPAPPVVAPGARLRLPLDSIAPRRPPGYASAALARLVAEGSARNRRVPPALLGYTATVESEIALVLKRAEGQEVTASLEQTSNAVRWRRSGEYEQRVVGYRATQVSIAPSMVGLAPRAWTVPALYGNRILLLFGADSALRARRDSIRLKRAKGDTARVARERVYTAEHPLGEERDRFYTYAGGDTVARVVVNGRVVEVARVRVEPRGGFTRRVVVFRGEMDLDVKRGHLVRLRGYFDEMGPQPRGAARVVARNVEAVAFAELVNQEVDGAWWLPSYQRLEPQFAIPRLGDQRSVMRVVSRWRDVRADAPDAAAYVAALARRDTTAPDPALDATATDTMRTAAHRLTFAPRDSLDAHSAWEAQLGAETGAVRVEDWDDVGPDRWRTTGPPRLDWRVTRSSDLVRFNRVEGLYTGYGLDLKLRDAAPGVSLRANAGYAWHERAARGRATLDRTRGRVGMGVRGGRWVDITNDFRAAMDSGSSLAALAGADLYDYVDRRGAAAYATRRLTRSEARPVVLRLETGLMRDAAMERVVRRAPLGWGNADSGRYRDNRGVREGRYARTIVQLELDPDMAAQALKPGVGALLQVEQASGGLEYTRVEARVLGRRSWTSRSGTSTLLLRGDAGAVLGDDLPPQQLLELGGTGPVMSGYDYKAFAGDRAMLGRAMAMHTLPLLRRPVRVTRTIALPGLAPGFSAGWQSGWASVGDRAAARRALLELAPRGSAPGTVLSTPTNGVKSSVDVRLRFFGGNASVGLARPVERGGRWRWVAGVVQEL